LLHQLQGTRRLAIIGIGADLREDDVVGNLLARELIGEIKQSMDASHNGSYEYTDEERIQSGNLLVLNATVAPELYLSLVKSFAPDRVIIIDAASMGAKAKPGDLAFITPAELDASTFSTHTISLRYFVEILKTMGLDAEFAIIGIQPANLGYGEALSQPVEETKAFLKTLFLRYLTNKFLKA